ncbi:hypothetical protein BQ8482_110463 [Mesorhizobium delmotii]|uniref:Uncharacterized protein n=1 Tax=Mesorhizobium delmotii TaxID=1631247 RepID=A0A2P9ABN4_9HYPH|nr:hypothetical protein BQ8482_110463 [Mesorhizobium delmotii]
MSASARPVDSEALLARTAEQTEKAVKSGNRDRRGKANGVLVTVIRNSGPAAKIAAGEFRLL